jgi:hypothetical protein
MEMVKVKNLKNLLCLMFVFILIIVNIDVMHCLILLHPASLVCNIHGDLNLQFMQNRNFISSSWNLFY